MGSWLELMEANQRLREQSLQLVEFCRRRATDPRRLTTSQRSTLIRRAERLEDATTGLTDMVEAIVRSPFVFGNEANPRTREGSVLGWHLKAPGPEHTTEGGNDPPVEGENGGNSSCSTRAEPPTP